MSMATKRPRLLMKAGQIYHEGTGQYMAGFPLEINFYDTIAAIGCTDVDADVMDKLTAEWQKFRNKSKVYKVQ